MRQREVRNQINRFESYCERRDGHLIWTGSTNGAYGRFGLADGSSRKVYAHRYAWELANGPIPDGMIIDHDPGCPKLCVEVSHLNLFTPSMHTAMGWQRGEIDGGWSTRPPMDRDPLTGRFLPNDA